MPVLKLDDIALGISRVRKGNPAGALNFSRYNLAKTGSPRTQDRVCGELLILTENTSETQTCESFTYS